MICRWAQELLGYQFSVLRHINRMMADDDALTRQFGPLIAANYYITTVLHRRDEYRHSLAYERTCFHSNAATKLTPPNVTMPDDPIIFSVVISNLQSVSPTDNASISTPVTSSSPVNCCTLLHCHDPVSYRLIQTVSCI